MDAFSQYKEKLSQLGITDDCLHFFSETDSTNTRARELLSSLNSPAGPQIFYAKRQTAGRGTRGRSFHSSEETGLWFSILYTPDNEDLYPTGLTAMAAVSVISAIESFISEDAAKGFYIKWVNDIFFGKRKVSGILSERCMARGGFFGYVIGIGINLYSARLPDSISDIAISVEDATGIKIEREALLYEITARLISYLENPDTDRLLSRYREKMLPSGTKIAIQTGLGEKKNAEIVGVNGDFGLTVKYTDGKIEDLVSADVSIRI